MGLYLYYTPCDLLGRMDAWTDSVCVPGGGGIWERGWGGEWGGGNVSIKLLSWTYL